MGTNIRPQISKKKKNEYWISKHRYYELKHFCLQYPEWTKELQSINGFVSNAISTVKTLSSGLVDDPTSKCAIIRVYYKNLIEMVNSSAKETDIILGNYIFKAVTQGMSYDYLKTNFNIPCCKETYYAMYRRFFWILSMKRQ